MKLDELMVKLKQGAEQQTNEIQQGEVATIKSLDDKDDASDESDVLSIQAVVVSGNRNLRCRVQIGGEKCL